MNVRELIEKLQEFDQELPVCLEYAEILGDEEEEDNWVQRFELNVDQRFVPNFFATDKKLCVLISPGY